MLYFAVQQPTYPRNYRLRSYLEEEMGAEVVIVSLSPEPGYLRHWRELLRDSFKLQGPFDVVILSEFSIAFAALSWMNACRYRARHLVDFFVGLRETHVEDRKAVQRGSIRGRAMIALEWLAGSSADLILIDTDVRGAALTSRFGRTSVTLPVGAPEWAAIPARAVDPSQPPRLLYYGNYIPLHGVKALIAALALAARDADFSVTMIGDGDDRALAASEVGRLGLESRVTFRRPIPEHELAAELGSHDIVIGIFGTSKKAAGVIANKVWQGLYANRVVVTRQSVALDEIRMMAAENLVTSSDETPESIREAIDEALSRVRAGTSEGTRGALSSSLEAYVDARYAEFRDLLTRQRSGST